MSAPPEGRVDVLPDSATLVADTGGLRERLRRDGALLLRGLLPPGPVAEVRRRVGEALARHGWTAPGSDPDEPVADANRREGSPGYWRLAEDLQAVEALHRQAHDPALLAVAERVVGRPLLNHPRRPVTLVHPGFWVPPHQEYVSVQGTADLLTAWVPLTPFPAGEGVRLLRERRHRLRPLEVLETGGVAAAVPDGAEWSGSGPLAPGDVVLLHGLTTWAVEENRGDRLRLAVQYRFQSARDPVCPASLRPHHYPRVAPGGWPDLTGSWGSRRWLRVPLRLRRVDWVLPPRLETWHEAVPPPASRLVGLDPA